MWIFVVESGVWLQISFAQLVTVAKHVGENNHENKGFKVHHGSLGEDFQSFGLYLNTGPAWKKYRPFASNEMSEDSVDVDKRCAVK